MKRIVTLFTAFCLTFPAVAVEPYEMLKDPAQEARAREVSKQLRCVMCQNETIDESGAGIARDMRLLVRERIVAGDSNEEIIAYMVSRYGDYVLLRPRFRADTLLLWFSPLLVLVLGGWVVARRLKRGGGGQEARALTAEEQADIAALTDSGEKSP